jgi:hypothetical protein
VANFVTNFDCNSGVPGATGFIAFCQSDGNQINKVLPILRIRADGSTARSTWCGRWAARWTRRRRARHEARSRFS